MKIKPRELLNMGFKEGPCIGEAGRCIARAAAHGMCRMDARNHLQAMLDDYTPYLKHEFLGPLAQLMDSIARPPYVFKNYNEAQDSYEVWGRENIEQEAIDQMNRAVSVPPAVCGAIMPDGHAGYGLPIGGVLALDNAVMPYGVGVDIACRMMMSVVPLAAEEIDKRENDFEKAIEKHTRFGLGAAFQRSDRCQDDVMDHDDWDVVDGIVDKDTAWDQLGSSGGGNHFVDVGEIEFPEKNSLISSRAIGSLAGVPADRIVGMPTGKYVAILTHSGSRGMGSKIATHFTRLAVAKHPLLPPQYKRLAWLSLDDEDGQMYWKAMQLAGEYASANHHCIHNSLLKELGLEPLWQIENHHNFAWKEIHDEKEVIVHRKGATPAGSGVLGIIPGSMAAPGYLVRGKGKAESLNSAAHGAGRAMSRKKAKEKYRWASVREELKHKRIKLISAGLDEVPGAYKPIEEVMAAQIDLVEVVAKFQPRLVKMAKAED
jgi:tRNA-splicing ligase RtcB